MSWIQQCLVTSHDPPMGCYQAHSTDEETEAQKAYVTLQGAHCLRSNELELKSKFV